MYEIIENYVRIIWLVFLLIAALCSIRQAERRRAVIGLLVILGFVILSLMTVAFYWIHR